ncbi:MAG TPA: hypothetical protein VNJ01_15940 [Bacteriovoracaceae bacterium]|nr:hypothetical protein [Bacteriovoracaceae bacterium]
MRLILLPFLLILFAACGKGIEQETQETIDVALTYLTDGKCTEAIDALEAIDRQNTNGVYLQVLASAYACRAGYNELDFIAIDVPTINTTSASLLFKSISILSLSDETEADSAEYADFRTALNVLLNSNGAPKPSQVARTVAFGVRRSGDMGVQLLFLSVVELGKFLNYYGNVNSVGAKGMGGGASTCFINYTDPRAQAVIAGNFGGACVSNTGGHADLSFAAANLAIAKRRICEGLVLFNNIVDILDNIDLSTNPSLSTFTRISTTINAYKAPAVAAGLGPLLETTSQSDCETAMVDPTQFNNMQYLYSLLYESGLQ